MVNITTNSENEMVQNPAEATADGKDSSMDSAELSMMMIEDSLGQFKEGEVVTGVITSVDKDMVLVDIGTFTLSSSSRLAFLTRITFSL